MCLGYHQAAVDSGRSTAPVLIPAVDLHVLKFCDFYVSMQPIMMQELQGGDNNNHVPRSQGIAELPAAIAVEQQQQQQQQADDALQNRDTVTTQRQPKPLCQGFVMVDLHGCATSDGDDNPQSVVQLALDDILTPNDNARVRALLQSLQHPGLISTDVDLATRARQTVR